MRQFSRVPFHEEALLTAVGRTFPGTVENLSMNGTLLVTAELLPIGEPVTVTLMLTGIEPQIALDFPGSISRQTENGLGIHFDKLDPDVYGHLRNIIGYNSENPDVVFTEINQAIDASYSNKL